MKNATIHYFHWIIICLSLTDFALSFWFAIGVTILDFGFTFILHEKPLTL